MPPKDSDAIIAELTAAVRTAAGSDDSRSLRSAFGKVLRELDADECVGPWRNGTDIIGSVYMRLLSGADRRPAGQVFTPAWAAQVMAGWAVTGNQPIVLDPGCGSGVLLLAAASAAAEGHGQFHGFDNDPLAVLMTQRNCEIHGLSATVIEHDFLLGETSLRPTAIVANPPYTRHHELSQVTKGRIATDLGDRLGIKGTRRASLHALFLARAVEQCADGGRIAFITPSQWLETGYGQEVQRFVDGRAHVYATIELPAEYFPNARTSASITLVEKSVSYEGCRRIRLTGDLPDVVEVLKMIEEAQPTIITPVHTPNTVPLNKLARVHRGVATGHNKFFVLSDNDRVRVGLSADHLRPCISSPRVFSSDTLERTSLAALPATTPRWVLAIGSRDEDSATDAYVDHGELIGANERFLCSHRKDWFAIRFLEDYPILFSYLNKANPHVVRNVANAVPLNTWLVIVPLPGVDPDALADALRSDSVARAAREQGRHYGHGLWKLEPSEVARLEIPWEQ